MTLLSGLITSANAPQRPQQDGHIQTKQPINLRFIFYFTILHLGPLPVCGRWGCWRGGLEDGPSSSTTLCSCLSSSTLLGSDVSRSVVTLEAGGNEAQAQ